MTDQEKISALRSALAALVGMAELDCMDDKSNVWRSAMIDARHALTASDPPAAPIDPLANNAAAQGKSAILSKVNELICDDNLPAMLRPQAGEPR